MVATGNAMLWASALYSAMGLSGIGAANVPAAAPGVLYIDDGTRVAAVSADTGKVLHAFQVGRAAQSVFIDAPVASGRLFLTSTVVEAGAAANYLDVYRTSDWTLERRVAVPEIIRYMGNVPSGIMASPDGRFVHVYNYNDRTRGASPVQYWLTTYDLSAGAWLPQRVDLPGCGASQLLQGGSRVFVLCYDSHDVRVIDTQVGSALAASIPVAPVIAHAGIGQTSVASGVVSGNSLLIITENREVHVLSMDNLSLPARVNEVVAASEKVVPFQPSGMQGSLLFVPSGSAEERSHGLASRLVAVDTQTGAFVRTLQPSQPFRWVTFGSDGESATLGLATPDAAPNRLIRFDLKTGAETTITSNTVFPGFVLSR